MAAVTLSAQPVAFNPDKIDTAHFFDDANRQILVVNRDTDVRVTPLDGSTDLFFKIEHRGSVISLKLSLDKTFLAIQRSARTVEFVRAADGYTFSQTCRSSKTTTSIIAFQWMPDNEVLFVTTTGLELFQITSDNDACKHAKSVPLNINWQIYSPESKILAVSTGAQQNSVHFFQIKAGAINKLPKFDIPIPENKKNVKLQQRDVCLALLYGKIYCVHISQSIDRPELCLYQITRDDIRKQAPFPLLSQGSYSVNFVDNLILAHNVVTKLTHIYDIRSPEPTKPVAVPMAIPAVTISRSDPQSKPVDIVPFAEGERWFVFHPDVIIAWDQGLLWTLTISLPNFITGKFNEPGKLLDFLLRRRYAKRLIMDFMRSTIEKPEPLLVVAGLFDQLNAICSTAIYEKAIDVAKQTVRERDKKAPSFSTLLASYLGLTMLEDDQNGNATLKRYESSAYGSEDGSSSSLPIDAPQLAIANDETGAISIRKSPVTLTSATTAKAVVRRASGTSIVTKAPTASRAVSTPSPLSTRSASSDSFAFGLSDADIYDTYDDDSPTDSRRASGNDTRASSAASSSSTSNMSNKNKGPSSSSAVLINQQSMYTWVFYPMVENKNLNFKFKVAVLTEYIRSLNQYDLPVKHYIYELVIHLLVSNQRCYQLHQFLQYHVVRDSVHVACLLLSLVPSYPPAYQLAIDMLKRLKTWENIVEVLLLKSQVVTALRFIRSNDLQTSVPANTFLDAAMQTGDKNLFYGVYKFFETRNMFLRNRPEFLPTEKCDRFVQYFESVFPSEAKPPPSVSPASSRSVTPVYSK